MSAARRRVRGLLATLAVCVLGLLALGAGQAAAASGWWNLTSSTAPRNLVPGEEGVVEAFATNSGYTPVSGAGGKTLFIVDSLPAGLEVKGTHAEAGPSTASAVPPRVVHELPCTVTGNSTEGSTVKCEWAGEVEESESIRLKTTVKVVGSEGEPANRVELKGAAFPAPNRSSRS